MRGRARPLAWLNPAVWAGAAVPLVETGAAALRGTLGADVIAVAMNRLGLLALVFLVASVSCTPVKLLTGWTWPLRIRRTLGLIAFSYVTLHFLVYAVLDQTLALGAILEDVLVRPFILAGFSALVLLIPLAVTSTDRMVRRLGFPRWKALHRLAYVAAGLGAFHFFLRVKADLTRPLIFAGILALGFGVRLWAAARAHGQRRRIASAATTPR